MNGLMWDQLMNSSRPVTETRDYYSTKTHYKLSAFGMKFPVSFVKHLTSGQHSEFGYLKKHLKEGRMPDCHEDYRRPRVMERLESLVSRIERKFTNLGLSTDVALPSEQDSPAMEDLYDGFNEDANDNTLVEDPPVFCYTQRNRIRSPSPSSTSSLGSPVSRSPIKATQMYQEAISNIGSSRNVLQTVSSSGTFVLNKRTKNEGVNICDDDWLVDDISDSKKKRKRPSSVEDVLGNNGD